MEALREYILIHELVLSPARFELATDHYERHDYQLRQY